MSAKAREIAFTILSTPAHEHSGTDCGACIDYISAALSAARAEGLREARLMRHEERDGLCLYCGRMNATGTLWAQVCTSRLEAAIRALAEEGKSPETPDGCPSKAGKCGTCGGSSQVSITVPGPERSFLDCVKWVRCPSCAPAEDR